MFHIPFWVQPTAANFCRVCWSFCWGAVSGGTNRELFAANGVDLAAALERGLPRCGDPGLRVMMTRVASRLERYEPGGRIMTDDRAPVELLSMRVMDDLIRGEVELYRGVLRDEGLRGLLASVSFD